MVLIMVVFQGTFIDFSFCAISAAPRLSLRLLTMATNAVWF